MSNSYLASPVTGSVDRKQVQPVATHLMLPVVGENSITNSKDVVNDATKSGKQIGAMVCRMVGGKMQIDIATGSKEVANWNPTLMDSVGLITPV